jgi:dynein heavy chain 1
VNLEAWVSDLDSRIEGILSERLEKVIALFCDKLAGSQHQAQEGNFVFPPLVHEVKIQNQFIYLDPPIEHARASWYSVLQDWLGVVCNLTRIQASRYEIGLKIQTTSPTLSSYSSLVSHAHITVQMLT